MTRRATASGSERRKAGVLALLLAATAVATAQETTKPRPQAYRLRRAITVSGGVVDDAVMVVENGKIAKIGKAADVEIPDEAEVSDLRDATATPGFLHVASLAFLPQQDFDGQGRRDGGDRFVADEIAPQWDPLLKAARAGFTRLNVVPADGGVGGHGCFVRPIPRGERPLRAEQVVFHRATCLMTGFAPRTTSKAFWTELFKKTSPKKEETKPEDAARGAASRPSGESRPATATSRAADSKAAEAPRDPKLGPVLDVLAKKLPCLLFLGNAAAFAHFEPYFKEQAAFRPTLVLRPDAWMILDRVKALGAPVVLSTAASQRPDTNVIRQSALEAFELGIPTALIPETSFASGYADFVFHLTELVRRGCDAEQVLRAVTLTPAEMLGVADETGSLEAGKTADVLFWSGDPLAPTSRLLRTMAAGEIVYDDAKEP